MFGPNTPGTLVVLAGAILLLISTLSTPIMKDIYFLSAKVQATVSSTKINATFTLGTLGYCLELGSQVTCSSPGISYDLSTGPVLISSLPKDVDFGLPVSLIKSLTYVLILHPIAAGLAFIAALFGLISHFREFSRSCFTSFFASLAAIAALLAFVFDIIAFTIAKSRINSLSISSADTNATLGKAIWITLAGWLCLASSGIFFCMGRCLIRRKYRSKNQAAILRPTIDDSFANEMRKEAVEAEKAKQQPLVERPQSSLPAFAEYGNDQVPPEQIPLARFAETGEDDRYSPPHSRDHSNERRLVRDSLPGVGSGYGKKPSNVLRDQSLNSRAYQRTSLAPSSSLSYPPHNEAQFDPSINQQGPENSMYSNLPPHVTPGSSRMGEEALGSQQAYPKALLPGQSPYKPPLATVPDENPYFSFPVPPQPQVRLEQGLHSSYGSPVFSQPAPSNYNTHDQHHVPYSNPPLEYASGNGQTPHHSIDNSQGLHQQPLFGQALPGQYNQPLTLPQNSVGNPYLDGQQHQNVAFKNQVQGQPSVDRTLSHLGYYNEPQLLSESPQQAQPNHPSRSDQTMNEWSSSNTLYDSPQQAYPGLQNPGYPQAEVSHGYMDSNQASQYLNQPDAYGGLRSSASPSEPGSPLHRPLPVPPTPEVEPQVNIKARFQDQIKASKTPPPSY